MKSGSHSIIFIFLLFISFAICGVDYASEIQPILNNNCISCHGGSGSLFLSSYVNLMDGNSNNGPIVTAGDGANSLIIQKLRGTAGTQMPKNQTPLDGATIELIETWIDEGANESSLSIISEGSLYPDELSILRNFPNPFNPTTRITYGLPENSDVQIIVYDISGKQIQYLLNDFQSPGYHSINWDASSYPSGMYFAEIKAGKYVHTKKLMLIK